MRFCWPWLLRIAAQLLLVDLCLAYRLQNQLGILKDAIIRGDAHAGKLYVEGCLDISVLSNKSPSQYSIIVSQEETTRGPLACGIGAAVTESYTLEESCCALRVLDLEADRAERFDARPFRQHLRLISSCGNATANYKVVDLGKQSSRRQLAAIALAPLADTGAAAPAVSAPSVAILNPAVPVPLNQSMPPTLFAPGPSVNVACCCGASNGLSSNTQSCCCGPISMCCQATGFCVSQNCTAIFVGSTLIAGALISFMTCGICIYRARVSLHEPVNLWTRSRRNASDAGDSRQRPWRPVPVHAPPDAEEGMQRDCPVCLEEVTKNAEWVIFPCHHGTCRTCYGQLVGKPDGDAACPLCRTALTEPMPEEEVPPEVAVQLQPMTREPAQPLEGSSAQLYVAPVNRPSLAIQD